MRLYIFVFELKFSVQMNVLPTSDLVKFVIQIMYQEASFMRKEKIYQRIFLQKNLLN